MRTKIYVSGPMSGLPLDNFPAFKAVTAKLRARGYDVVCPTEVNPGVGKPAPDAPREVHDAYWSECIRADIAAMAAECGAIVLIPGWQYSKGAHMELGAAHRFAMRIVQLEELLPRHEWFDIPFPVQTLWTGLGSSFRKLESAHETIEGRV